MLPQPVPEGDRENEDAHRPDETGNDESHHEGTEVTENGTIIIKSYAVFSEPMAAPVRRGVSFVPELHDEST